MFRLMNRCLNMQLPLKSRPLPKGNRVAIITNAGGPGIMTTDAIELSGLVMADSDA